jgi:hypothetical protein
MAQVLRKNEFLKKEYLLDVDADPTTSGAVILTLKATDPNGNELPEGFVVTNATAIVEEEITATGGSLTFGTTDDPNGFLADFRAAYAAAGSIVRSGEVAGALLWDDTNDHEISYKVGATSALQTVVAEVGSTGLTTGKVRFILEGYVPTSGEGY